MNVICFVLVMHRISVSFGQYLSIPGLLSDDGPLPRGRPTFRSDFLQADLGLQAPGIGAGLSIRAGLPAPPPPPPPEPGCKGGCPGGQICVQNSCTCHTGWILTGGLCGKKLVPLIQSVPGGTCASGEECTGGSVCQDEDGICCCPPDLVQVNEVCILPPPFPLPRILPPPMLPLPPILPRPLLPSLSLQIGRNLLGIIRK